jgi:hypothetical protein
MRTPRSIALLSLSSLLALGGCTSDKSEMSYEIGVADSSVGFVDMGGVAPESAPSFSTEPDIITTGYLSLVVDTPSDSADAIATIVTDAGGRVASRQDYTPVDFGQPSSFLEVRIPSASLDDTVEAISAIGTVQEISVNTTDVSLQKVDLDARIQVLTSAINRLTGLLERAETTSDVVTIESALAERQAELDSLQSRRDYLSDQTLFATLGISLVTPVDATPRDPDGFFDGLVRGWESVLAFFAGTIVWAGILVPWVGLGLVVIALVWVVRLIARSRRNRL